MRPISGRRTWAVTRRQFAVLRRSLPKWFDMTVWPLLDVVLWGALGAYIATGDAPGRAGTPYLLAGIILFHVLFQAHVAVATGFMEETWTSNLLNVMATPVREVEYAVGLAIYGIAKLAMGMATVTFAAWAVYRFDTASIGWPLVPICLILMLSGWALSQVSIGLMLRFGPSAEILTWGLIFVILAVSGVFNPVEALPGALQPVGRILPTTHAFAALRTVQDGGATPWGQLAIGLAGALVSAVLGLVFVVRMLHVFRDRGYVTRFS
jgi:ABC-2 type transport system permease protein